MNVFATATQWILLAILDSTAPSKITSSGEAGATFKEIRDMQEN